MRRHPLARRGRYALHAFDEERGRKLAKTALVIGLGIGAYFLLRPKPPKGSPMPKASSGRSRIDALGDGPIASRADFAASYGPVTAYKVQPFDSLTRIADSVFGNKALFAYLFDINRGGAFQNPNDLKLGQTLLIPTYFPLAGVDAYAARYAALAACYNAGSCKVPPAEVMAFTPIPL
jgi:nucleoid-associated protein YgaU